MTSPAEDIHAAAPPDVYADSTNITTGIYGTLLRFGVTTGVPGSDEVIPVVNVRMSPQHAFVLCQLLKKQLRQYQEQIGAITIPAAVLEELGLDSEL